MTEVIVWKGNNNITSNHHRHKHVTDVQYLIVPDLGIVLMWTRLIDVSVAEMQPINRQIRLLK